METSVLDSAPGPMPGPRLGRDVGRDVRWDVRQNLRRYLRRHTGSVAALVAVVGFAVGSYGAYRVVHTPSAAPILLRQATEPERMATYDDVPGSGGVLVLLRNDGAMPVQVIDAAFARTSAAPPLYIAPQSVPPGGEVNVFVAVPGRCFSSFSASMTQQDASPVQITVGAQEPGGPVQFVPVAISGELAQLIAGCFPPGSGS